MDTEILGTLCAELGFELERQELEPVASTVPASRQSMAYAFQ